LVPEFGRVGSGFVVVGWNPGSDDLPRRFDGLEGLDIERQLRRWWETDRLASGAQ
jgi:hypothetical protein